MERERDRHRETRKERQKEREADKEREEHKKGKKGKCVRGISLYLLVVHTAQSQIGGQKSSQVYGCVSWPPFQNPDSSCCLFV